MLTLQLPAAVHGHGLATSDCDSHHLARTFIRPVPDNLAAAESEAAADKCASLSAAVPAEHRQLICFYFKLLYVIIACKWGYLLSSVCHKHMYIPCGESSSCLLVKLENDADINDRPGHIRTEHRVASQLLSLLQAHALVVVFR